MDDVRYGTKLTRDAAEHAAGLSSWDQRYEQISAGRFEGRLEELRVGPIQIFRESTTQTVFQNGQPRAGTVTLGLSEGGDAEGWFCGHRLGADQTIAISSTGEFELVAPSGMGLLAVCIDATELARHATRVQGDGFELALPMPSVLDDPARRHVELKRLLETAILLAGNGDGSLRQPASRGVLVLAIADLVLGCIAPGHVRTDLPTSAAARRRIVNRARDYMESNVDAVITVPDLCSAAHASRRALQYAFEEVLHISPVTYLRAMRLNRVRRDLTTGRGPSVGDVAARWGFWHPSRFASDYRSLFGELPSATLARCVARSDTGTRR